MQQILDELKTTIDEGHYYSALTLALSLPDICSQVEYGKNEGSCHDYIKWINDHMDKKVFTVGIPGFETVELNGAICYALRCRVFHNTDLEIEKTKVAIKENIKITDFKLVTPDAIKDENGKPAGWQYQINESKNEYIASINVQYLCKNLYETILAFYNNSGYKNQLEVSCYKVN